MYQFGPYGPNHATAGTFAFKRELLDKTAYDDSAALAEEKAFLKNYTVPFVQLDPMKTILVFSHEHNTFDKRRLLEAPHTDFVRESAKTVPMFVKSLESRRFFMEEIDAKLSNYAPGRPDMKPDVIKQIVELEERHQRDAEAMRSQQTGIVVQKPGEAPETLTYDQTMSFIRHQENHISYLTTELEKRNAEIAQLRKVLNKAFEKSHVAQPGEIDANDLISQINS